MTLRIIVMDDGTPGAMPAQTFSEETLSPAAEEYIRRLIEENDARTPALIIATSIEIEAINDGRGH
jgi:hypothetical protein